MKTILFAFSMKSRRSVASRTVLFLLSKIFKMPKLKMWFVMSASSALKGESRKVHGALEKRARAIASLWR